MTEKAKPFENQLFDWLQSHRPALFEQIKKEGLASISTMEVLNRETGLNVRVLDTVEEGSQRFLEALKAASSSAATSTEQTTEEKPHGTSQASA